MFRLVFRDGNNWLFSSGKHGCWVNIVVVIVILAIIVVALAFVCGRLTTFYF